MGSMSSTSVLPTPYKKVRTFRGPDENNKYEVETGKDCNKYIKFKYDTRDDDGWCWKWTPYPDQRIWYTVKEQYYEKSIDGQNGGLFVDDLKDDHNNNNNNNNNNNHNSHGHGHGHEHSSIDITIAGNHKNNHSNNSNDSNDSNSLEHSGRSHSSNNKSLSVMRKFQLPYEHELVRKFLAENDPLPPHILRQKGMSNNAYLSARGSRLANSTKLQTRFATKDLNGCFKHPAVIFFETEPTSIDDTVIMLHMMLNAEHGMVEVVCESRSWQKLCPGNTRGWAVSEKKYQIGCTLCDIAKWCVQYEAKNPDYTKLNNNCRHFMLALSTYLKIQWGDVMMAEKIWYTMNSADNKSFFSHSNME